MAAICRSPLAIVQVFDNIGKLFAGKDGAACIVLNYVPIMTSARNHASKALTEGPLQGDSYPER